MLRSALLEVKKNQEKNQVEMRQQLLSHSGDFQSATQQIRARFCRSSETPYILKGQDWTL